MSTHKLGNVYFLMLRDPLDNARDLGLVKIGITSGDLSRRIATLQTGNPYELVLFDSLQTQWPREVEHFMHRTHASEMLRTEWIRCSFEGLPALVLEASMAAERIDRRKSRESQLANTTSNGMVRRATLAEFRLHREVRSIFRRLIPAKLRLQTVEALIHAATIDSCGIEGVVRVRLVPSSPRLDHAVAESRFPTVVAESQDSIVSGAFRWRRVPRLTDFPEEFEAAASCAQLAQAGAALMLHQNTTLSQMLPRTREVEAWHSEYLQLLPIINRLEGDLADLRTELTQALEEFDAMDPVCSFVRRSTTRLDAGKFRTLFPDEYRQCLVPVEIQQLRKVIYPNRSYLPLEP